MVPPDEAPGGMDNLYDPDDEEDYDLSPGEEIDIDEDEESDELDGLENPRITELGPDDDEEVPRLTPKKEKAKSKNKRPAEDEGDGPANLDDIMAKSLKPAEAKAEEPKLSKKQLKKLKNNAGQAVPGASTDSTDKTGQKATEETAKEDKKVHFAKNIESEKKDGNKSEPKPEQKKDAKKDEKPKATVGVKVVQGVTIDDKKLGTGPAAKKGDTVAMRYIGKLQSDNSVFDGEYSSPY